MSTAVAIGFLATSILFIVGIKMLSSPRTARLGNVVAATGMLVAIVATLPLMHTRPTTAALMLVGLIVGFLIGAIGAYRVQMTGMPQMVALFNAAGGGAAALVAAMEFARPYTDAGFVGAMLFAALIGAISFSGSVVAFLKLEGKLEKPITYPGQQFANGALLLLILLLAVVLVTSHNLPGFILFLLLALVFGVLMVLPIGGADMPVVISLLNSFTGLAVAADGFAISNIALIIAGTLVGSSGTLLTLVMCRAMNRPVTNVLFGAFGQASGASGVAAATTGTARAIQADEAASMLAAAEQVVIVPGYGMAVAQAQHVVKELADHLESNGTEVRYAIHPVAGRMPGHMNVLLAEADVSYDQLVEMEAINPTMPTIDVALVIGANDVVNPAAREDKSSPIFGMPIIDVDKARTVFVMKRSMASGFAGIENPLFFRDNVQMLFGDAKKTLQALVNELTKV